MKLSMTVFVKLVLQLICLALMVTPLPSILLIAYKLPWDSIILQILIVFETIAYMWNFYVALTYKRLDDVVMFDIIYDFIQIIAELAGFISLVITVALWGFNVVYVNVIYIILLIIDIIFMLHNCRRKRWVDTISFMCPNKNPMQRQSPETIV